MSIEGLDILIAFARGAIKDKVCAEGDRQLSEEFEAFLRREAPEKFIEEQIALKLDHMWPRLQEIGRIIGKDPFSKEVAKVYILGHKDSDVDAFAHNGLMIVRNSICAVFGGRVESIMTEGRQKKAILKGRAESLEIVSNLNLKVDDRVAFHRGSIILAVDDEDDWRRLPK